jgi:hypothetical protein
MAELYGPVSGIPGAEPLPSFVKVPGSQHYGHRNTQDETRSQHDGKQENMGHGESPQKHIRVHGLQVLQGDECTDSADYDADDHPGFRRLCHPLFLLLETLSMYHVTEWLSTKTDLTRKSTIYYPDK